jgi:hypothetical protein
MSFQEYIESVSLGSTSIQITKEWHRVELYLVV